MTTKALHPLVQKVFDSTEKDDTSFVQSLVDLLRAASQSSIPEPDPSSVRYTPATGVAEESESYNARALDAAHHTVGEALKQFLTTNSLSIEDAARRLGASVQHMQGMLGEMMPLTGPTVKHVAKFFARELRLHELTLRHWLITGLRELEMKDSEHSPTRMAARRKRP